MLFCAEILKKLIFDSRLNIFCRLDAHIKQPICSDEIVEVCGASGAGKTYLCLKMASLALLEQETAVIYVDTTNYVNHENMSLVLSVSNNLTLGLYLTFIILFLSELHLRDGTY